MNDETHMRTSTESERTDVERPLEAGTAADAIRETSTGLSLGAGERLLAYLLASFWGLFWFWNAVDHAVTTDAVPLFKGRFRYDGIYQLFSTIGLENQYLALVGLNVATVLEVAAFVSLGVALWSTYQRDARRATDFFTVGMLAGITVMTYFAVGDVVFGHRAELREHTLYWMYQVVTLVIYLALPTSRLSTSVRGLYADNRSAVHLVVVATLLVSSVAFATSYQRMDAVTETRNEPLEATQVSDNVYRLVLPPAAGQDTWEQSIVEFERTHPGTCVVDVTQLVWPAPNNAKVLYLTTEPCDSVTAGSTGAGERNADAAVVGAPGA